MTFEEYVLEEIIDQDLYEDIEIEDNSIVYSYDLDYTIQDWFFVPLFYLTMTKGQAQGRRPRLARRVGAAAPPLV